MKLLFSPLLALLLVFPLSFAQEMANGTGETVEAIENQYHFEVFETEEFHVRINAVDPDGDPLQIRYDSPLDKNGRWKTTYEDAGFYDTVAVVSDGADSMEIPILLEVKNRNRPIENIIFAGPDEALEETQPVKFSLAFEDHDKSEVFVKWMLDGEEFHADSLLPISDSLYEDFLEIPTTFGDHGIHVVELSITDGESQEDRSWNYTVTKKNRLPEFEFSGLTEVAEGQEFILYVTAEDPDGDDVTITFAQPLNELGVWTPDFTNAGLYALNVTISDGEAEIIGVFNLSVADVNHVPQLEFIEDMVLDEMQTIDILLQASDEDDEPFTLSVEALPDGASFEQNRFRFQPTYDAVTNEEVTKTFSITVFADDTKNTTNRTFLLTVNHVNRPPAFDIYGQWGNEISANEGDRLVLAPKMADPDNDPLIVTYSGWMESSAKTLDYDDAGTHTVVVIASDGEYSATQTLKVRVNNINDAPDLATPRVLHVWEGETLEHSFRYKDADPVQFYVSGLPAQLHLEGDTIFWTPAEDVANPTPRSFIKKILDALVFWRPSGSFQEFTGMVTAVDSFGVTDAESVTIRVYDRNIAPLLISSAPASEKLVVYKGDIISFHVEARDSDVLMYTWKFGAFDSKKGDATHRRQFTKLGLHNVKVEISDGKETITRVWEVEVVPFVLKKEEPEPVKNATAEPEKAPVEEQKKEPVKAPPKPKVITFPVE